MLFLLVETQSNQLETTTETSLQELEEQIPQVQEEVLIQVQEEPTLQVQELYTGWNNNQSQYFQNGPLYTNEKLIPKFCLC